MTDLKVRLDKAYQDREDAIEAECERRYKLELSRKESEERFVNDKIEHIINVIEKTPLKKPILLNLNDDPFIMDKPMENAPDGQWRALVDTLTNMGYDKNLMFESRPGITSDQYNCYIVFFQTNHC